MDLIVFAVVASFHCQRFMADSEQPEGILDLLCPQRSVPDSSHLKSWHMSWQAFYRDTIQSECKRTAGLVPADIDLAKRSVCVSCDFGATYVCSGAYALISSDLEPFRAVPNSHTVDEEAYKSTSALLPSAAAHPWIHVKIGTILEQPKVCLLAATSTENHTKSSY